MAAQRGRSERDAEAYFLYVEALSDARTKLQTFSASCRIVACRKAHRQRALATAIVY